ncbi:Erg28-like protein, partial [Ramicandelaber brevisporus]
LPATALGKWVLLTAGFSFFNTWQCYYNPRGLTLGIYNLQQDQVTPLASRLFGTWTFCVGFVRLYAAYNLANPVLFDALILTYAAALSHFSAEVFVYKTAKLLSPVFSTFSVAVISLGWLLNVR